MWGNELISGFAGLVLSLVAPLANTALVAPTTGTVDCGLTVSQSGVTSGTTVQLTWWTVNAASVTMSDNGSQPVNVNPSGSIPLTINANHSFALVARNAYGSKTCTASITSATQTNNGPTCAISATPGTHYAGQGVQIVWYSQNATTGQVGGVGEVTGTRLSSGSATIYPQQSTTVSMQVRNNYGSNTCSAPITITPRPSSTTQQPTYTTTSYRPVTTPSYAPTSQPLVYRPTTSGSPSYSNPSYSNARYPSPAYSSGWYPDTRLNSPSYTNGLGGWTLTNQFLDVGSGRYMYTDQDCYGAYCDNLASSWGSASPNGTTMYGGSEFYNGENYGWSETYDRYGTMIGRAETPSLEESNAILNDSRYSWTSDSVLPNTYSTSNVTSGAALDASDPFALPDSFGSKTFNGAAVQSGVGVGYNPDQSLYESETWSNASIQTDLDASMSDGISTGNREVWNPTYDSSAYQSGNLNFGDVSGDNYAYPVYNDSAPAWYSWEPNGWNAGNDAGSSGVYYSYPIDDTGIEI